MGQRRRRRYKNTHEQAATNKYRRKLLNNIKDNYDLHCELYQALSSQPEDKATNLIKGLAFDDLVASLQLPNDKTFKLLEVQVRLGFVYIGSALLAQPRYEPTDLGNTFFEYELEQGLDAVSGMRVPSQERIDRIISHAKPKYK